jgi:hypothetical protein
MISNIKVDINKSEKHMKEINKSTQFGPILSTDNSVSCYKSSMDRGALPSFNSASRGRIKIFLFIFYLFIIYLFTLFLGKNNITTISESEVDVFDEDMENVLTNIDNIKGKCY